MKKIFNRTLYSFLVLFVITSCQDKSPELFSPFFASLGKGDASSTVNLTHYKLSNWSDKIIVSTEVGASTSSSEIFSNQTVYISWAASNTGTTDITTDITAYLYIDDVKVKTFAYNETIKAGYYVQWNDIDLGTLTAGNHTFKIVIDPENSLSETIETDNEYSITKTISVSTGPNFNLLPYKPSGWDNSLVVTKTKGSTTTSSTIYSSNTIYLNYAVTNLGTENISQTFSIQLLVDGVVVSTGTSAGLATNYYTYQKDINIGTLSGGKNHTFEIRIDPNNELLESNESDNVYTITKYIY